MGTRVGLKALPHIIPSQKRIFLGRGIMRGGEDCLVKESLAKNEWIKKMKS
jgi:hypothetical protein